jgi:hypothetical protein
MECIKIASKAQQGASLSSLMLEAISKQQCDQSVGEKFKQSVLPFEAIFPKVVKICELLKKKQMEQSAKASKGKKASPAKRQKT